MPGCDFQIDRTGRGVVSKGSRISKYEVGSRGGSVPCAHTEVYYFEGDVLLPTDPGATGMKHGKGGSVLAFGKTCGIL